MEILMLKRIKNYGENMTTKKNVEYTNSPYFGFLYFGGIIFLISVLFWYALGGNTTIAVATAPTQTLYLSANLFPIKITPIQTNVEYAFLGTPQSNGTACISGVAIYPYNYTIQNYSSTPQTITFNPKEVAGIYYTYGVYYINFFRIPDGYTLLCPDIVNATK